MSSQELEKNNNKTNYNEDEEINKELLIETWKKKIEHLVLQDKLKESFINGLDSGIKKMFREITMGRKTHQEVFYNIEAYLDYYKVSKEYMTNDIQMLERDKPEGEPDIMRYLKKIPEKLSDVMNDVIRKTINGLCIGDKVITIGVMDWCLLGYAPFSKREGKIVDIFTDKTYLIEYRTGDMKKRRPKFITTVPEYKIIEKK